MSIKNRATLISTINAQLPDNDSEQITAATLRGVLVDIVDSCLNRQTDTTDDLSQGEINLYFAGCIQAGQFIWFKGTGNTGTSPELGDFRVGISTNRYTIQVHNGTAWDTANPLFQIP